MEEVKLQDILESDKEMILENIAADPSPAAVVNVLDRELDRMLYRYAEGCPDENAVTAAGNMIKSVKNSLPFLEAVDDVKEWVLDTLATFHEINPQPNGLRFEPEYFEVVDARTLQPIADWSEAGDLGAVGCIAVWLDGVRLIDIVKF